MKPGKQAAFLANWTSQARKGFLELLVLNLLGRREHYGYELVERMRDSSGIEINDGTLYAILARLQKEGFIQHRWEHLEKGPARKYYDLTPDGKNALKEMRAVWEDMAGAVRKSGARNV